MATIEADAYALLERLGATPVSNVSTAGGGAANAKWTALRSRALGGLPVTASQHGESMDRILSGNSDIVCCSCVCFLAQVVTRATGRQPPSMRT